MSYANDQSPIFGDIDAEHGKMRHILGDLHSMVEDRRATKDAIVSALDSFVEYLRDHFAHEDEGGFFQEITAIAPRLSGRANAIGREHVELLAAMEAYRDTAKAGTADSAWWDHLDKEFHRLMKDLMQHEHREQNLLQEAFHDDIGAGD